MKTLAAILIATSVLAACGSTPITEPAGPTPSPSPSETAKPVRHTVAFGRFAGRQWKIEVFTDSNGFHCMTVEEGGRACTSGVDPNDHMSLSVSWPNGSGRNIFIGWALPEVRSIVAELKDGSKVDIPIIKVRREVFPWHIYVGYFPSEAHGHRVARGGGKVLERDSLYRNDNR